MRWFLMSPEYAATTGRQYITIVNLTPHRFKLTYTHSYQMDEFNWGDIPSGKARQNVAHYTERVKANPVDDNGKAYYDIGDTGKKFVVRSTTHIPDTYPRRIVFDLSGMGKGQREYRVPEQEVPVTLVITGSDSFGFITSLSHGTHDSGMSKLESAIITGASESNTQTQGLNIYDQLRVGARWFDLRVSTVHYVGDGTHEFWTTHLSDEMAEVTIGKAGERFNDVVNEINKFTSENPGEVIALQFRYLVGVRNVPSKGPVYWDEEIKNEFFEKLIKIENRCGNLESRPIQDYTMDKLMSSNDGKGCVLIFLDTVHMKNIPEAERVSTEDGIYRKDAISWTDAWPDKEDTKDVAEFAIDAWKRKTNFHVGQWISTPNVLTSTFVYSIQAIAVLPTNPALYWKGVNSINPDEFPNVLLVDYIGMVLLNDARWDLLSAELYTLAIGLNLRSPLLPSPKSQRRPPNPLVSQFNGIIFANGTTIENPPPGFHPGRVEILRNGTVFGNGTVLKEDVPNPDVNSTLF
ncbi:PLC-like phosphodiesterase [Colletotrichum falcatum]|nr:PLC-like phosphodiesterase [Colletotrichum falcatum]